jgi:uncharacterized iron-regulated protein
MSGQPLTFAALVQRCAAADAILLGEEHGDFVCNQFEAQLFHALAHQPRRIALALEFFETDTQAALDAYLQGRVAEPDFRRQARQGRAYLLAHRPLIEFCRAADVPVLAANAPRRLVRDYRKSGLDYLSWRAGLAADDQVWLPARSPHLSGPYEDRFLEMMSGHDAETGPTPTSQPTTQPAAPPSADAAPPPSSDQAGTAATGAAVAPSQDAGATSQPSPPAPATGPAMHLQPPDPLPVTESQPVFLPTSQAAETPSALSAEDESPAAFYRAQLLWDDAMAESLALYRARHPADRVLLIVGSFHVADDGGTTVKFRNRRPRDRVLTLVYRGTTDTDLAFDPEDRGTADILIYGIKPPAEQPSAGM